MAGTLRLSNTGTGNGQSTITTAASGDTTYTLPGGGGTFVTTSSTQALTVPFASGTVSAPSVTFLGDTNTGIYSPAADTIAFTEGGVESLRIDSSGRVGIGSSTAEKILTVLKNGDSGLYIKSADTNHSNLQLGVDTANSYSFIQSGSAGSGSALNMAFFVGSTERARLDTSGRLLIGTSTARLFFTEYTPAFQLEGTTNSTSSASLVNNSNGPVGPVLFFGKSRAASVGGVTVVSANDELGVIAFNGADGTDLTSIGAIIKAEVDSTPGNNDLPTRLVFSTTADGASSPTERMRITNNGQTSIFCDNIGGSVVFNARSGVGASAGSYFFVGAHSATSTTAGGTNTIVIYTNGNVQNTNNSYGALSDIKLKENIVDANSQWGDIKALQVRNYNFKEGQTHTQIGLVAQEVELVSPGLVSESPDRDAKGNDLGTVTKSVNYSVLYMKAVKALQEAMLRIEDLEARLDAANL